MIYKKDKLYVWENYVANTHVLIRKDKCQKDLRHFLTGVYPYGKRLRNSGVNYPYNSENVPVSKMNEQLLNILRPSSLAVSTIIVSSGKDTGQKTDDKGHNVWEYSTSCGTHVGVSSRYKWILQLGIPKIQEKSSGYPIFVFDCNDNSIIAVVMPFLIKSTPAPTPTPTHKKRKDSSKMIVISEDQFHEYNEMMIGICVLCKETTDGCEPDAKKYRCMNCETNTVYGTEELLLMGKLEIE